MRFQGVRRAMLAAGMVAACGVADPTAAQSIRCQAGFAGGYPCSDLHLLSELSLDDLGVTGPSIRGNDHWGWADPSSDLQVVIFGLTDATVFVDITDPEQPVVLGTLPSHEGTSTWRDTKVFGNTAYIVADVPTTHGMQVFDLTQLRTVASPPVVFDETAHYDGFGPGHNLWINRESGFLYVFRTDTCGAGVHIIDLAVPLAPIFAGCLDEGEAPLSDGECVRYVGPDPDYAGREICFIGSDDNVAIADVTNKGAPVIVSSFTYPGLDRAHQGSLTADQRYWVLSDTKDELENGHPTRTHLFDIADLDSPTVLGFHEHATSARDHNLYIVDETVVQANFKAGLRILDIGGLPSTSLDEIAFFDTDPDSDSVAAEGAWTAYPWWRDSVVSVSSTDGGLLLLGRTLGLEYGTYLGGELADRGHSVVTDGSGFVYVAGTTQSTSFPGADRWVNRHGVDAFVAKLDPAGAVVYVLWVDAVSASAEDEGFGIATDVAGNAYVVGQTNSEDFCSFLGSVPGADTTYNGNGDAFVFKVNPDGTAVDYCTFLGGSDWETGRAIAVDAAGVATVTGATWSADFPTTPGVIAEDPIGSRDAFVVRLDATGTSLVFATHLGGTGQDEGRGIALDRRNAACVTGWTTSDDLPTGAGVAFPDPQGDFDAFVGCLTPTAGGFRYLSYFGGSGEDRGTAIAADALGRTVIAGTTGSADFPTTAGAFDPDLNGATDGFAAVLEADGSVLSRSTLVGGSGEDWVRGMTISPLGDVVLTGETWSVDLPTTVQALTAGRPGDRSASVHQFDSELGTLRYGSYLGGGGWGTGNGVAMGAGSTIVVTGATDSVDFPVTPDAVDPSHNGDHDAFVARLRIADSIVPEGWKLFNDDFETGDLSAWFE